MLAGRGRGRRGLLNALFPCGQVLPDPADYLGLVAEPDQGFERDLIAEPVFITQFENLGIDEALDQPEHIGVGAALNLADEPLFVDRQGREGIGHG